jgi:hypothetical protein
MPVAYQLRVLLRVAVRSFQSDNGAAMPHLLQDGDLDNRSTHYERLG